MRKLIAALLLVLLFRSIARADASPWMPAPAHTVELREKGKLRIGLGVTLIALGFGAVVGGLALVWNGVNLVGSVLPDCHQHGDCAHWENNDGQLGGGIALGLVGLGLIAGGIPLAISGGHLQKRAGLRVSLSGATLTF